MVELIVVNKSIRVRRGPFTNAYMAGTQVKPLGRSLLFEDKEGSKC